MDSDLPSGPVSLFDNLVNLFLCHRQDTKIVWATRIWSAHRHSALRGRTVSGEFHWADTNPLVANPSANPS